MRCSCVNQEANPICCRSKQVAQDAVAVSAHWDDPELSVEHQNGAGPATEQVRASHMSK